MQAPCMRQPAPAAHAGLMHSHHSGPAPAAIATGGALLLGAAVDTGVLLCWLRLQLRGQAGQAPCGLRHLRLLAYTHPSMGVIIRQALLACTLDRPERAVPGKAARGQGRHVPVTPSIVKRGKPPASSRYCASAAAQLLQTEQRFVGCPPGAAQVQRAPPASNRKAG